VRRIGKAIATAVLAAWFALLGAELWLQVARRLAWPATRRFLHEELEPRDSSAITDREEIWAERYQRYQPGAALELAKPGGAQHLRINALGFRGGEIGTKVPGALRVACVGGSTTIEGPEDDATYPARLEAKLRERFPGRALEVLNLGVSATWSNYWLAPERERELLAFEPDLVVQYDGINDLAFVHLRQYAEDHPWRRWLGRSLLLDHLLPPAPDDFDPLFEATLRNQLRLARGLAQRGIGYVGGTFATPDPARLSPLHERALDYDVQRLWGRALGLDTYAPFHALVLHYDALAEERMRQRGVAVVPVHRELVDPALFSDVCHLTPQGIEALADALLPAVAAQLEAR
jgi:lysophospholipase L1-like esterase